MTEASDVGRYTVAATPFFTDDAVKESITRVAGSREIVIFAGAGVTIDQTGTSWKSLIRHLLSDHSLVGQSTMTETMVDLAENHLEPIQAATVLRRLHKSLSGVTDSPAIAWAIRSRLYGSYPWIDGPLSRSVAELAIELASLGIDVVIATTNYEILIEEKLRYERNVVGRCPEVIVSVQGTTVATTAPVNCAGRIIVDYLHGRISRRGVTNGRIALDELDYFDLQTSVADTLTQWFTRRDVLILGSSLVDPHCSRLSPGRPARRTPTASPSTPYRRWVSDCPLSNRSRT